MHFQFKKLFIIYALIFLFPIVTYSALLSWEPNLDEDLKGYLIYYGKEPGVYDILIDVGNVTDYEILDLEINRTYYFRLTAYDGWGNESTPTPEFVYTCTPKDKSPPFVANLEIFNSNTLILSFSEPIKIQNAELISNYCITPDITIYKSIIDSTQTEVILQTEQHQDGNYEIIVSNICDISEIPNIMNNQSIQYTFQSTWVPSLDNPNQHMKFSLSQNYPNPFNAETAIEYSIAKPGYVQLIVFDSLGRKVNVLINKYISVAGLQKRIIWNGKDENGNPVSSGLYYCQVRQESNIETKQMILMK